MYLLLYNHIGQDSRLAEGIPLQRLQGPRVKLAMHQVRQVSGPLEAVLEVPDLGQERLEPDNG
jgi:hypothetical protein